MYCSYTLKQKGNIMKYLIILVGLTFLTSCQTGGRYDGQVGPATKWGAGIGAVTGAVIGHNKGGKTAEGAGIGAVLGGGIGYVIDKISGGHDHPHNSRQAPIAPQPRVYHEPYPNRTIRIRTPRTIYVEENVPVQRDVREYYIDPRTGRRIYIRR
jgi:hypothetical protein